MLEKLRGQPDRGQRARRRGHDRQAQAGPRRLIDSSASASACGRTAPSWRWRELLPILGAGAEEREVDGAVEYALYAPAGELPSLDDIRALAGDALLDVRSRAGAGRLGAALARVPAAGADRRAGRPAAVDRGRRRRPRDRPGRLLRRRHARDDAAVPARCCSTSRRAGRCATGAPGPACWRWPRRGSGWAPVTAVEVDPGALERDPRQRARNGVAVKAQAARPARRRAPWAPTVVANLTRALLLDVAAAWSSARPTRLLASGMLRDGGRRGRRRLRALGLRERRRLEDEGWAARGARPMIRLAVRVAREHAEPVLAELLELVPGRAGGARRRRRHGRVRALRRARRAARRRRAAGGRRRRAGRRLDLRGRRRLASWRDWHRPLDVGPLRVRPPWEPRARRARSTW